MGYGDELMAAGRARDLYERGHYPVLICGDRGQARWHDVWRGNPRIVHPDDADKAPHQILIDGPRCRPYVDTSDKARWKFRPGQQVRGDLALFDEDRRKVPQPGYLVVSTHAKRANKRWQREAFAEVVRIVPARWVQVDPLGVKTLRGVERVNASTFREAAAVIEAADGVLVHEGGLHHAAAVWRKSSVVLFGHFISPDITGYPEQFGVYAADGPCGRTAECADCALFWRNLKPEHVAKYVQMMQARIKPSESGTAAA